MASELRVNSSTNRSGLGTITYTDSGPIVSGVGTFANGLTVDGTQTTVKSLRLTGDNYSANWFKTSSVFRLNDNAKLNLGSADDMQQYHDGTTTWIKNTNGGLRIENTVSNIGVYASHSGGDIIMRAGGATSSENAIVAVHHGEVVLSFNGSTKLTTTNTGVTIAGTAVAGALDISGDIDVDGHTNLDNVSVAGVSTFSSTVNVKKTSGTSLLKLENTNGSGQLDIRHTNGYGAVHYVHQGTEKWRVGQTAQADHFSVYQSSSVSDGLPYRFFIQNNGEVGINTSDPANTLHLLRNSTNHGITLQRGGTNAGTASINVTSFGALDLTAANNFNITSGGSQQIIFNRGGTAVGNFDTSGALNIGRNPAQATGTNTQNAILTIKGYPNSETSAAILALVRGNDTTSTANNHTLGRIVFSDKQAGEYAFIEGEAEANGAVGDTPGRLVFSTAPDNTSAPTEKLRIDSNGKLTLSNSEGIQLSAKTSSLYTSDGAISYYATNNAVYINGAGASGWMRLSAAGTANNRTAINIYGHSYATADRIDFRTNSLERLRIDSSGNLTFANNSTDATANLSSLIFANGTGEVSSIKGATRNGNTNGMIIFNTDISGSSAEKFRVNHDGGFCYGTDSSRTAEFTQPDGFSIRWDDKGQFQNSVSNSTCGILNRKGSDGNSLTFRKDGSAVGHIGVNGSTMYLNFGGTTGTDHQLDDYEEGTHTSTDASGASLSISGSMSYTKIGRLVHILFDITYPSTTNGNVAQITIPFAYAGNYGSGVCGWTNKAKPTFIHINNSGINFMDNDGGSIHYTNDELSTKRFIGATTYFTNA